MFLSDALVLGAAFVAAHALRTGPLRDRFSEVVPALPELAGPGAVLVVMCLIAVALSRSYEDRRYLSRLEEYATLLKAVAYGMLAAVGLAFLLKHKDLSRGVLLLYWAIGSGLLVLSRSTWHQIEKSRRRGGRDALRAIAICPARDLVRIRDLLRRYPDLGYRLTGRLPADGPVTRTMARLDRLAGSGKLEAVLIGVPEHAYHRVVPILAWCEEHGIPHHRLASAFDAYHPGASAPRSLPGADARPLYGAVKRMVDELSALVGIVVTSPLWLLIAVAIKLDSSGPVFFIQERVGRHGRLFRLWKFRTMYVHAPRYALTVRRTGDPRVTPVGRILRRTSLDELPQLVNILRGEMSLVGPRPEMPFMMNRNTPEYRTRLMVLPGLTGLWQAVARHEPLEESLKYDLYYIQRRSLLFDAVILLRTGLSILTGRGAI